MARMSDNKKVSFVIYDEWATLLVNLPTEEAGQLIQQMCAWKLGQPQPESSKTIMAMFSSIQPQMEKDAKKWEEEKKKRSEAGHAGAEARWGR